MRIEHLNLVVKDLQSALKFYHAAFPHWKIRGGGESEYHGVMRKWIHFGDEHNYLSINDSGKGEIRKIEGYDLGLAHFAYVVDDLPSLISRMENAGFDIAIDGSPDDSHKSVYYIDPDGYEVEFLQYFTDIPQQRNLYDQPQPDFINRLQQSCS